ncbi:MAG: VWA domain-containing protein [Methylibium sp.]|uniref:vWA domain-containing protein n=1 Tax=Methylibium sp. TaxID=2067992 RepID=UPI0017B88412|nr:vWA domain-containing protein [Methylibium sp.]MBA3599220.1 VWA domain-containing protein [Methylibium sp.]
MLSNELPFTSPWLLLALPLALLALWRRPQAVLLHSWSALLPPDRLSGALDVLLRVLAVLAIAAVLLGLAGLYRPAYEIERVGQGAEIVLLVDRSRSMDQAFISGTPSGIATQTPGLANFNISRERADRGRPSKQQTARVLLGEFAAQRSADRFAMLVFSTLPIRVLDFTEKPAAVQAAIAAGEIGRGLAETDIGLALEAGLGSFHNRPYTGSRIMMLVSDGGDDLTDEARTEIARRMSDYRVTLYWFYIRSFRSPGLNAEPGDEAVAPEVHLHRFFGSMGTPYRAYEAENPEALQRAINDVNRLENLPITYLDTVPRRDLSQWCYGAALGCVLLLLTAKLMELRAWR